MSNINFSMDYRGMNISGSGGNIIIPDPFDEINVKTLNIVDDGNLPYYTMPREEVVDTDGDIAVFKPDGTSSLQQYIPPAYLYMSNGQGSVEINSISSIDFRDTSVNLIYNITRVADILGRNTVLKMSKGTYLCTVNFFPLITATPNNIPPSSMYFSIDGSTDPNPPFRFFKTYGLYQEYTSFTQIISVDSPNQEIRLQLDNRNNTAGTIDLTPQLNVSITKIGYNLSTFLSLSQTPINTSIPNSIIGVIASPVQPEYDIPFPIINNLLSQSLNSSIVNTPPNPYTSYSNYSPKAIRLNGFAQNKKYTLTLSARIGIDFYIDDLDEIKACFQSSVDNINWTDIGDRQQIFSNQQASIQIYNNNNIPLYIQREGWTPVQGYKEQYVRAVVILIPKLAGQTSITQLILQANGGLTSNFSSFNPFNAFFQIYPDDTTITSNMIWKQTADSYTYPYFYPIPLRGRNPSLWYRLPPLFAFLPVVMNNYIYPTNNCKTVNNQPLIYYPPNFLRSEFGIEWSGVKIYATGSYTFEYNLYIKIASVGFAFYDINVCTDNPCNILYNERLNAPSPNGLIGQTITTTVILNAGDFVYPLLTWDNDNQTEELLIFGNSYFSLTPNF